MDYRITDFGATVCDYPQTEKIQKTIDTCFLNGGGKVIVPSGIFLTGGIRLRSNVTLYLECGAILKGSNNPEDYFAWADDEIEPISEEEKAKWADKKGSVNPYSNWNNGLIRVISAENVSIIGEKGSYIDGVNCYNASGEENYRGPHAINVQFCKNLYLEGYTIINSANWAHAIFTSENITAKSVTVLGGHDGFDVRTCDNILIENSEFYTGDDCIAGFDNNDVIVRNCILNSACSSFRFGGNNVLIENCKSFAPARFGFRGHPMSDEQRRTSAPTDEKCRHNNLNFFLYYCDFRAMLRKEAGNITVRNCEIINTDRLFCLPFDGTETWCKNRSLCSIKFENCKVTGVEKAIYIHGDEKEPIDFSMSNIEICAKDGFEDSLFMEAENYSKISLNNVTVSGLSEPAILDFSSKEIDIANCNNIQVKAR